MSRAAFLILFFILPGLLASGAGPSRAQSFTRTFELKGLEDGDFRIRVFVRQSGSSEGRVVPLSKIGEKQGDEKKSDEKQADEKQAEEKKEGDGKESEKKE